MKPATPTPLIELSTKQRTILNRIESMGPHGTAIPFGQFVNTDADREATHFLAGHELVVVSALEKPAKGKGAYITPAGVAILGGKSAPALVEVMYVASNEPENLAEEVPLVDPAIAMAIPKKKALRKVTPPQATSQPTQTITLKRTTKTVEPVVEKPAEKPAPIKKQVPTPKKAEPVPQKTNDDGSVTTLNWAYRRLRRQFFLHVRDGIEEAKKKEFQEHLNAVPESYSALRAAAIHDDPVLYAVLGGRKEAPNKWEDFMESFFGHEIHPGARGTLDDIRAASAAKK